MEQAPPNSTSMPSTAAVGRSPGLKPLGLADLTLLFQLIYDDITQCDRASSQLSALLRDWLQETRRRGLSVFDWLRLLVPAVCQYRGITVTVTSHMYLHGMLQEDTQRTYAIREDTLAKILVEIFGWETRPQGRQLLEWRHAKVVEDQTASDLAARLCAAREDAVWREDFRNEEETERYGGVCVCSVIESMTCVTLNH